MPSGWPAGVRYIERPDTSGCRGLPGASAEACEAARAVRSAVEGYWRGRRGGPVRDVRIRRVDDAGHPAHGQCGLFAARKFAPREWVIDYCGELVPDGAPQLAASDYALTFCSSGCDAQGRFHGFAMDASRAGNEARFVNDYRGVPGARRPNVEFSSADEGGGQQGHPPWAERSVGFRVLQKGIRKGEELLASYGKGFWKGRSADRDDDGEAEGERDKEEEIEEIKENKEIKEKEEKEEIKEKEEKEDDAEVAVGVPRGARS